MNFFGVGILELGVILTIAVLVIGPDRVPSFAADLAKWIRQARSYANHMMKDFNEVVSEVQKEAGSSADDWKEIASVFNRHTGDVVREVGKAGTVAGSVIPNEGMANGSTVTPPPLAGTTSATNGSTSYGSNGASATPAISGYGSTPPYPYEGAPPAGESQSPGLGETGVPKEELAWYVPERRHRRRALDY